MNEARRKRLRRGARPAGRIAARWAACAAVVVAAAVAAPHVARADIDGDQFTSHDWKVRITAPRNWQITEKTSYPSILLVMVRHDPDGRMLLSAQKVAPNTTALSYATRTSKLLESIGFSVRPPQIHGATGAYWIDCNNRRSFLRQAFLVTGGIGYSLTLAAPDRATRAELVRAFDYALRSIRPLRKHK